MLCCAAGAVDAQKNPNRQPQNFKAFWLKFKTAVARNDKEAVASMTKLPFLFESQELDRAGFVGRYKEIISRSDRRCFARARPLKDTDSYSVFCGNIIFVFSSDDGVWKFSGISPND
jgi:hypothetical protein